MIVVTGASGQLGRAIVKALLKHVPAVQIVASVRDFSKAAALAKRGVVVRSGNFEAPRPLASTFEHTSQFLVISVDKLGRAALEMRQHAIEAAKAAGVQRVLYISHQGGRLDSPFAPARDHAITETALMQIAVPYASLRHGFYAESVLHLVGHDIAAGEIRAPEDGPVSWTSRMNLAEADATVLTKPVTFEGISPPLTASRAVTMFEMAELTGRDIERVTLTDKAWFEEKVACGVPAPMATMLLGRYLASRRGDLRSLTRL